MKHFVASVGAVCRLRRHRCVLAVCSVFIFRLNSLLLLLLLVLLFFFRWRVALQVCLELLIAVALRNRDRIYSYGLCCMST